NKDMHKPAFELRGFGKTKLLQPGESQTLSIVLQPRDLASFSEEESAWVAHAGQYRLYAASSSEALGQPASFVLPARQVVEKCGKWLLPRVAINEWQPGR
ncbi:MAG: fibronectin type III-like domain-contianing protein, partial [Chitinophagaceae bacterium]|nr:fibronectin type III-like domain-contianing protein [Chitinophagaceae bacterium]